jgi:hypothetical protein
MTSMHHSRRCWYSKHNTNPGIHQG